REEKGDVKTRVLTVRSNQNNSYTSKKKVQCSKDSTDEEKSEELDYQSGDEEMVEVKTNRMFSGVWKYFKRLSSEVVKIDIIKKHTEQKITTSKLAKEYNVNASTILINHL
ncbi:hypothetical protein BpHYR1_025334, partial [Brachionus plicatilis]